jgi:hypothetical protein
MNKAPVHSLTEAVADMRVGDRRVMDYGCLKSTITRLRALQDGRRWSLNTHTSANGQKTFELVRRA